MIRKSAIKIMALFCAISSASLAQTKIGLDVGGTIYSSAVQNFGQYSPQAKLAADYAPYIPVSYLTVDANGLTIQNPNGEVQSANVSDQQATEVAACFGVTSPFTTTAGTRQTVTSQTINGSKITYSVTIAPNGQFKVTYTITVKITAANINATFGPNSKLWPLTAPIAIQQIEASNASTNGGSGSGGTGTPPPTNNSPPAPDANSTFFQNYQGKGSDFYKVTYGTSDGVVVGTPIVIAWWE